MGMSGIKEQWEGLRQRLQRIGKDRWLQLLLWLGLAGILLLALSEVYPAEDAAPTTAPTTLTETQVEAALEKRITALLRQVEGVGSCRVMVTLESGARTVYATNTDYAAGVDGSTQGSESYLTVDTDTGPVGLLLTHIQPTVKGVAVVCDGGADPTVCQRVVQVISTAFHISERRVCVVKQE